MSLFSHNFSPRRVYVSTRDYEFEHGARPYGRGTWLFYFGHQAKRDAPRDPATAWQPPGGEMLFGAARDLARKEALRRDTLVCSVAP